MYLTPKKETRAAEFLNQHPDYDGSQIIVGVLDTGVDPGAAGLLRTPDGNPKIIDLIDCTGDGNVDMSCKRTIVHADADSVAENKSNSKSKELFAEFKSFIHSAMDADETDDNQDSVFECLEIESVSGYEILRVPTRWLASSVEFIRVGRVRAFDLFPPGLVARLKRERKEKRLGAPQQKCVADLMADKKNKTPENDLLLKLLNEKSASSGADNEDFGPYYDCIAFEMDGIMYGAVDITEFGDFTDPRVKLMTSYRAKQEFASFGLESNLNFSLNFMENGDVLSIVVDCSSHGTHVASIIGAHFPDHPEKDGVAPGCQIVGLKIGDRRVDSEETIPALIRALEAARLAGCHIINLSFGEDVNQVNTGRFIEMANEFTCRHNGIFVAAAGNEGPALGTVGCPGGTTSSIISVSAYVTADMKSTLYSLPGSADSPSASDGQFTWSSRGPTVDGDLGVSVTCPGGAITSVPTWTMNNSQLMNGTSMAAPNLTGCLALVLSGLVKMKVKYTPHSVRRALEHTALSSGGEVFGMGHGLVQVDRCFDEIVQLRSSNSNANIDIDDLSFSITSLKNKKKSRGIYLREREESESVMTDDLFVRAIFPDIDVNDSRHDKLNEQKQKFELNLRMKCDADWVKIADFVCLNHSGRVVPVIVDPRNLERGKVHYTSIQLYIDGDGNDNDHYVDVPLCSFPVTVIRPLIGFGFDSHSAVFNDSDIKIDRNEIVRRFIAVPQDCSYATIVVKAKSTIDGNDDHDQLLYQYGPMRIFLHMLQSIQGHRIKKTESQSFITVGEANEYKKTISVVGGVTLEVCLAGYWSNQGAVPIESCSVSFGGLNMDTTRIQMIAGVPSEVLTIKSQFRREKVSPKGTLTHLRRLVLPRSKPEPDISVRSDERDTYSNARREYEMILDYDFKFEMPMPKTDDAEIEIVPSIPALHPYLYDSPLDAQMWCIRDKHGRVWGFGDSQVKYSVKLPSGAYRLTLCLRHYDVQTLQKLKRTPLQIDRVLKTSDKDKAITAYSTSAGALFRDPSYIEKEKVLSPGSSVSFYLCPPSTMPHDAQLGDVLVGTVSMSSESAVSSIEVTVSQGRESVSASSECKGEYEYDASGSIGDAILASKIDVVCRMIEKEWLKDQGEEKEGEGEVDESESKTPSKTQREKDLDDVINQLIDPSSGTHSHARGDLHTHTSILNARMKAYCANYPSSRLRQISALETIIATADSVLDLHDQDSIARRIGYRKPEQFENPDSERGEKEKEKEKESDPNEDKERLIDAIAIKAFGLLSLHLKGDKGEGEGKTNIDSNIEKFKECMDTLHKWIDTDTSASSSSNSTSSSKVGVDRRGLLLLLHVMWLISYKKIASAIDVLNKYIRSGSASNLAVIGGESECGTATAMALAMRIRRELFVLLGWNHWGQLEKERLWGCFGSNGDKVLF